MKKISFKKGLLIYAAVLLVIIIGLLLGLRGILVKYEKAQDYNLVEEFVGKLQNDLVFNKIDSAEQYIDYSKLSRFEDKDTVVQNYISVFGGKKLEYALSSQSHDPASPIYIIHSGDLIAGELKLKLVSEEIKLDMLSIPTWAIEKFTPELSATGKTYAIQAPEEYKVVVNGYELTKEDISSKENSVALYMVKGLSKDPVITIANANGESVPFNSTVDEKNERLVSVRAEFTIMNFTIPASFTVASDKAFTVTKNGNLATYSVVFNDMPDVVVMNSTFKVTAPDGNVMQFEDKNGVPTPKYYEYTLVSPDTVTVKLGDAVVDRTDAEKTDITNPQYSDVTCLLKSSLFTATPLFSGSEDASELSMADSAGNTVLFNIKDGVVSVDAKDITITIPDNFTLSVNGNTLITAGSVANGVTGTIKDISEYEDIKEYVSTPKAVTFTLAGQYVPVKAEVTDNRGDKSVYAVSSSLSILDQAGTDEIPASLKGVVDPIYYGKQWSLFMTNDLAGATNGYATIRKYIKNDSYLDTFALQWATGVDITFLGSHRFDDPPFSKEKVSNFIVFSDTVFSCDVYFIKSFTVNSNGVHRDDVFSKRLYFVYTDDDKDGTKSWIVVSMPDIEAE